MKKHYKSLVFAAMCLALALALPFLTGQIPKIGQMLGPMHIPVLLCGFICGPVWGTAIGVTAPLLRSMIFSAPPFPNMAVPMAFELAAYGLVSGLLYRLLPKKVQYIYVSLIGAMISGRVVYGIAKLFVTAPQRDMQTLGVFIAGAFTEAVPGIILQLVLIPLIIIGLKKAKLIKDNEQ